MGSVLGSARANRIVWTLVLLVVGVLMAGCTGTGPSLGTSNAPPRPQAQVITLPGDKAVDISPALPVSVRVTGGVLQHVALTNRDGKGVAGSLSADRRSWTSTEPLGYGRTYTWGGTAAGPDDILVPVTGSFTTVEPREVVHATVNIGDGDTVGIAAPIILQFDHHVADKAAVQRALRVQTSVPMEGSWA
ncbi:MAG: Ig-like domain-containing protein, partial [Pseudonocardiaceae bacterium]